MTLEETKAKAQDKNYSEALDCFGGLTNVVSKLGKVIVESLTADVACIRNELDGCEKAKKILEQEISDSKKEGKKKVNRTILCYREEDVLRGAEALKESYDKFVKKPEMAIRVLATLDGVMPPDEYDPEKVARGSRKGQEKEVEFLVEDDDELVKVARRNASNK